MNQEHMITTKDITPVWGNGLVVHFLKFLSTKELQSLTADNTDSLYFKALERAGEIAPVPVQMYHNASYGGGILFHSIQGWELILAVNALRRDLEMPHETIRLLR